MLTAFIGAVAIVGIPSWVKPEVTAFIGIAAKLNAPPTNPWSPVRGPAATVAAVVPPVAAKISKFQFVSR